LGHEQGSRGHGFSRTKHILEDEMTDASQKVIFRGLSKAELAELQEILGIEPETVNVVMKDGQLSVVEHPLEDTLGEPLTWAAILLFAKNSKIGERATVLLDKILKNRRSLTVSKSITVRRANGDVETVDLMVEAKGDAVEAFLTKLRSDALMLDSKISASTATIEHLTDESLAEAPPIVKSTESSDPAAKAKRVQAAKAPAKKAAASPNNAAPMNGKKGAAKTKGK
jgi:hypothetical protein